MLRRKLFDARLLSFLKNSEPDGEVSEKEQQKPREASPDVDLRENGDVRLMSEGQDGFAQEVATPNPVHSNPLDGLDESLVENNSEGDTNEQGRAKHLREESVMSTNLETNHMDGNNDKSLDLDEKDRKKVKEWERRKGIGIIVH